MVSKEAFKTLAFYVQYLSTDIYIFESQTANCSDIEKTNGLSTT